MQSWVRKQLRDDMRAAGDFEEALNDCEEHLSEVQSLVQGKVKEIRKYMFEESNKRVVDGDLVGNINDLLDQIENM